MGGSFVQDIADEMLSETPSLARMRQLIADEGITEGEAGAFLYDTALKINRDLFYPLSKLELLLAEGCDMACSYCFESAILDPALKRRRIMSDEVIRRAVDLLFDHCDGKSGIGVTLFGGEPTLNFHGIRIAVSLVEQRAAARGVKTRFDITTNGLHLTEEMIAYFAEHDVHVLVSVDGSRASHDRYRIDRSGLGTFDRVMANVALLKRYQPWIGVKVTVMPSEAAAMADNVRALHAAGVNQFVIGAATGVDWSEAETAALMDSWARLRHWYLDTRPEACLITDFEADEVDGDQGPSFGCGAGRNTISVNVAGQISGCSKIISLDHDTVVGELGDVWHGLYRIGMRRDMAGCAKLIRNCEAAGIAESYRGGCFATNYEANADLYMPNLQDHEMEQRRSRVIGGAVLA